MWQAFKDYLQNYDYHYSSAFRSMGKHFLHNPIKDSFVILHYDSLDTT